MIYTSNDLSRVGRNQDGCEADGPEAERDESAFFAQSVPLLSAEAELDLAARIKTGDRAAREELTLANMRLVVNIASQFKVRGMELDDLIQEGNLGLMRATEDFDPETHGTRFSTYAACWIRNYIMRATSGGGSMIHFPYYLVILRKRFDRVKAEMVSRRRSNPGGDQSEPTMEDVAEQMGIEARRLRFLRNAQADCSSYSASTLDAEEAGASEDLLSEERPPEKPLETAEEMERLYAAFNQLTPFEAWLVKRRFRLDDRAEDVKADRRPRSQSRSRPASRRDDDREAKRIKRANDLADEPRPYRELERECGLAVYRLKQIERKALDKLQETLVESPAPTFLLPAARSPRPVARRASA
ncbi:sigma-70 family RNA polymerase sigma factor [Paludisphaera borealis]|uniref:RNA polymerase sigma factor SigA n=1 Tax=Paludisphaera borealis TaxID=1387353 RepID=A0A1U7CJZ2_9BACT|nr:sigma-70 family RNA polymerase sigma factor [Paludisphaera borealis]APW59203.1 RNA polymerase sigma factor SigA [Paludisphaera borealis]